MDLLLLDFDGVLNTDLFEYQVGFSHVEAKESSSPSEYLDLMKKFINPHNLENLKKSLAEIPNLKIVISSNWGKYYSLKNFKDLFISFGISNEVFGVTPKKSGLSKNEEIKWFMKEIDPKEVGKVLIIDDEDINFWNPEIDLLKTDPTKGFSLDDSVKMTRYFLGQDLVWKNKDRGLL